MVAKTGIWIFQGLFGMCSILLYLSPGVRAFDCVSRCSDTSTLVTWTEHDDTCTITMPDNPYQVIDPDGSPQVIPCQMEIHSNCSNYCNIQLKFNKFSLGECDHNITNNTAQFHHCDMIDMCEYLLIHEDGFKIDGTQPSTPITHFHGHQTNTTFLSTTDKIKLQFCYRTETFSARNIQIEFKAIDTTVTEPLYIGPASLYILSFLVVLMIGGVGLIGWNSKVKQCLDPPPPPQKATAV